MTEELTYTERSVAMSRNARNQLLTEAGELWQEARVAAGDIKDLEILCLNNMREAGMKLNLSSGREQLLFNLEGLEFCRKEILPHLPPEMDLNTVKLCVHLANKIPEPIENHEQLQNAKAEVQQVFSAFGLADAPKRREMQTSHARDMFVEFTYRFSSLPAYFDKLKLEIPYATWPRSKIEEALFVLEPVKLEIATLEKLLLEA
jgi:hypothetical protein